MVYVVLVLGIILSTAGAFVMKVFENRYRKGLVSVMLFVAASSAVASFCFLCMSGFRLSFSRNSLLIGLAMGVAITLNTPTQIKAYSVGNVSVAVISSMLGSLIGPFVYGIAFLNESFTLFKGLGLACFFLTAACFLPSKAELKKGGIKFLFYCFLVFLFNAIFFTFMKVHSEYGTMTENALMFFVYGFMAVAAAVIALALYGKAKLKKQKSEEVSQIEKADDIAAFAQNTSSEVEEVALADADAKRKKMIATIILVVITAGYGLANSLGNFCSLYCSGYLSASVQFPILSGGIVISSTIGSAIFFKEKITLKMALMCIFSVMSIVFFSI
mgnify:CR=1 FL=1